MFEGIKPPKLQMWLKNYRLETPFKLDKRKGIDKTSNCANFGALFLEESLAYTLKDFKNAKIDICKIYNF